MRANRRADTKPEVAVRSALHRLGLRFRKHHPIRLPNRLVKPDVVFTRQKVAVFIDGCFWHGCPEHGTTPKANSDYWKPKLERNKARDREVDLGLAAAGWTVIRVWEHDDASMVAATVRSAVVKQSNTSQV
ncbi:MAG: very short patch repair endonuclease [Solirubrobacterales bacterium]|nr:very short patch repair endonuclease [Solirubrobacterales bacterium]